MKKNVLLLASLFLVIGANNSSIAKSINGIAKHHTIKIKVKKPLPVFLGSYVYNGIEYNFEGSSTGKKVVTGVSYISGGSTVYLSTSDFSGTWAPPTAGGIAFVTATVNSPSGLFSIAQDLY